MSTAKLKRASYMMLTHREGYSTDTGDTIGTKFAKEATGLFGSIPAQRKNGPALWANEDGLFPGHSQTWRVER